MRQQELVRYADAFSFARFNLSTFVPMKPTKEINWRDERLCTGVQFVWVPIFIVKKARSCTLFNKSMTLHNVYVFYFVLFVSFFSSKRYTPMKNSSFDYQKFCSNYSFRIKFFFLFLFILFLNSRSSFDWNERKDGIQNNRKGEMRLLYRWAHWFSWNITN